MKIPSEAELIEMELLALAVDDHFAPNPDWPSHRNNEAIRLARQCLHLTELVRRLAKHGAQRPVWRSMRDGMQCGPRKQRGRHD
jgi:hypothetical protein